MEASDMMVILKDKKEWTTAKTFPEMAEKMSTALEEVPGITAGFQFPVQMRFNELMTGARQDVVCKIFGENLDTLAHYANELGKLAGSVEGAKDIYIETVTGLPQIIITHNRAAIAQYGLSIDEVNRVVNAAFGGQSAGMVYEDEKRFALVVRLTGNQRQSLADVQNLLVPTPLGAQVPLNQLATVAIKDGPNQIQREDAKRRIMVGFNVRGKDVQTIVNELQQKTDKIKLPPGYYITYGGAFENLIEAKKRLSIVVPLALGLIFLMLYFAFHSLKHSLIIYTAIPLSAIGGAFALALRGMPFSISAGIGFIALFGVAVLNGIVLIAEFRRLKAQGLTDPAEIALLGTRARLRPVLMTATVASLGFLPMALSNGAGAEVQRPLATVVIGGLLTATFLTLFLLPVLYLLFEKRNIKMKPQATVILLLLSLSPVLAHAQQQISLKAAIDSALHNNLKLKAQRLNTDYYKKMQGSGWDINKTNVTAEWGHVNSAYTDTRYGVTQSISFPLVYVKQRTVLHNEWKAAQLQTALNEKEITRQVSMLYNAINCLYQKQALLVEADSLYAAFEYKAQLRYKLGASNTVEKATAENQRGQIHLQLEQLQADLKILLNQFDYWLNTDTTYIPTRALLKPDVPVLSNTTGVHPYLTHLQLQQQLAKNIHQLEQAKLLPDITGGYYNQSFSGWQKVDNTERLYTSSQRFSSVQLGVGIPLIFASQAARIKAAAINRKMATTLAEDGKHMLDMQYDNALVAYKKQADAVVYYEQTGNKNAAEIIEATGSQYMQGDISYLEYTMLLNQAFDIYNRYYDELKKLNESIFEINYLIKN
jgi:cobalt-zinc-cadmium resistance protein CzcA